MSPCLLWFTFWPLVIADQIDFWLRLWLNENGHDVGWETPNLDTM